jgi:hypothetical protein
MGEVAKEGEITIEEEKVVIVTFNEWGQGQLIAGDFSDLGQKLVEAIANQLKIPTIELLGRQIKLEMTIKVKYQISNKTLKNL